METYALNVGGGKRRGLSSHAHEEALVSATAQLFVACLVVVQDTLHQCLGMPARQYTASNSKLLHYGINVCTTTCGNFQGFSSAGRAPNSRNYTVVNYNIH